MNKIQNEFGGCKEDGQPSKLCCSFVSWNFTVRRLKCKNEMKCKAMRIEQEQSQKWKRKTIKTVIFAEVYPKKKTHKANQTTMSEKAREQ